MPIISAEKFYLWKKKQILKGGDNTSLTLLIDLIGGLSNNELNLLKIKSEKKDKYGNIILYEFYHFRHYQMVLLSK